MVVEVVRVPKIIVLDIIKYLYCQSYIYFFVDSYSLFFFFFLNTDNLISALGKMDLNNWGIRQAMQPAPVHSRISLSPNELGFASASYFNGRDFERHQVSCWKRFFCFGWVWLG